MRRVHPCSRSSASLPPAPPYSLRSRSAPAAAPPTDASKTEFCATATDRSWAEDLGEEPDGEAIVDGLESWGSDLDEVGTPEGISDDARDGFDITVDYLGDLDPGDFDDLEDVSPADDLSEDDRRRSTRSTSTSPRPASPTRRRVDVPEPSIS